MKKINYRGGLISFEIPENWVEEFEEPGGGTFYEDTPTSGTLRVNVLTIENKKGNGSPLDVFKDRQKRNNQKEYTTQWGDEIVEYLDMTEESGIPITIFTLACAHKTEGKDFILAIFTWTIETRFEYQESYIREWNLIRNSIQNMKFGR